MGLETGYNPEEPEIAGLPIQAPDGQLAWDYLLSLDRPIEVGTVLILRDFIDDQSRWVGPVLDFNELIDLDEYPQGITDSREPTFIMDKIGLSYRQLFEAQQDVLDKTSPNRTFINLHQLDHARRVSSQARNLMMLAGGYGRPVDWRDINAATVAGMLHDIGSSVSGRKDHHRSSAAMMDVLFSPDIDEGKRYYFDLVKDSIYGHDIPTVEQRLFSTLSEANLAVLAADKMDIGINRVNGVAVSADDLDTRVNFFTDASSFRVDRGNVVWQLDFSLTMPEEYVGQLGNLGKPGSNGNGSATRKVRPLEMHELKDQGKPYFQTYQENLLAVYPDRIFTVLRSLAALFNNPDINTYTLVLNDDKDDNYQEHREFVFTREEITGFEREYVAVADKTSRQDLLNSWLSVKMQPLP